MVCKWSCPQCGKTLWGIDPCPLSTRANTHLWKAHELTLWRVTNTMQYDVPVPAHWKYRYSGRRFK